MTIKLKEVLITYLICAISLYDFVGDIIFLSSFKDLPIFWSGCVYVPIHDRYVNYFTHICPKDANDLLIKKCTKNDKQWFGLDENGYIDVYDNDQVGDCNFDTNVTISYTLLIIISAKELVKCIFIISYFFSKQFQNDTTLRFASNSPILLFILPFSTRLGTDCIESKKLKHRTLGLVVDVFLEDIPQLYLPIWYSITFQYTTLGVISLTGSIIMLIKNVILLIKHLCNDYNSASEIEENTVDAVIGNVEDGNTKFSQIEQKIHNLENRLSTLESILIEKDLYEKEQIQMTTICTQ
eukprot:406408_1